MFSLINNIFRINKPLSYQPGDRVADKSYYMGVSESTGTDFYLFIESAGKNKTADTVTFYRGTDLLRKKFENKEVFRGYKFSEFQLESEIIASYKNNTADGGNRRLTGKEWAQVAKVFEQKPKLLKKVYDICRKSSIVQSASEYSYNQAVFHLLGYGYNNKYAANSTASVLVGRSEPHPK